ncbi:MAG: hypothetical protein WDN49_26940 [Acetobacteraceae bacterium]
MFFALCLVVFAFLSWSARAADLKVATWNLEWLTARVEGDPALPSDVHPKVAADIALLRRYAAILDADVVALQEVDGPGIAAAIFPPDQYALYFTNDPVVQRVGVAVRRSIHVQPNPDVTALDLYPSARFPLRSGVDLTLDLPGGKLRLLAVHLKTGCQRDRLDTQHPAAMRDAARPGPRAARLGRPAPGRGRSLHPARRFQPLDGRERSNAGRAAIRRPPGQGHRRA